MADAFKDTRVMRCPVCFSRDTDVLLEREDELFYCVKCSFTGRESEIRSMYKDIQKKFQRASHRIDIQAIEEM